MASCAVSPRSVDPHTLLAFCFSLERVAAAVGEGAQVVATLHAALAAIGTEPPGLRPTYLN